MTTLPPPKPAPTDKELDSLRAEMATLVSRGREWVPALDYLALRAERDRIAAVAATAYGAALDWEQILQEQALWEAQDDIAKSRVACIEAEARIAALEAQLAEARAFFGDDEDFDTVIAKVKAQARADAIREAALRVDCNCNERCQFDDCSKPRVRRILALLDTPAPDPVAQAVIPLAAAIEAVEAVFPGALYLSNRTKLIAALRALAGDEAAMASIVKGAENG